MMNQTFSVSNIEPELPPATLAARPPLLSFIGDQHLPYVLPQVVYWGISMTFHFFELHGWFPEYRLHTPDELLKRNRATRAQVVRTVLNQQFFMCVFGYLMSEEVELSHTHEYGVALWAKRLRAAPRSIPLLVRLLGVDNVKLGLRIGGSLGALLATGKANYCLLADPITASSEACVKSLTTFSKFELAQADVFYWILVPALQFLVALFLADSMQYFTHRALHNIPYLYKNIHYQHHDLYVSYAYGALYNHPVEGIPIDGIGFPICLRLAQMTIRQSTLFGVIWTIKTVTDHAGYQLPWDPCNMINNVLCPNSMQYHDLHHQTWGMKYNFSAWTPFWDYLLGTMWDPKNEKSKEKYARMKQLTEREFKKEIQEDQY